MTGNAGRKASKFDSILLRGRRLLGGCLLLAYASAWPVIVLEASERLSAYRECQRIQDEILDLYCPKPRPSDHGRAGEGFLLLYVLNAIGAGAIWHIATARRDGARPPVSL